MQPLPQSACPLPGAVPDHQVDDADASAFLLGSDLPDYLYFVATPGVTDVVVQHGADFNKFLPSKPVGGWWLKTAPEKVPNYKNTKVAAKVKHPLTATHADLDQMAANLPVPPGGWPNPAAKATALRHHLLNTGHDAVLIPGTGEVVLLNDQSYKVVVPHKTAAPHPSPVVHASPTAVPVPGASNVTYVPAKPGDVTVGMTIKTSGGTGTVSEMKGKAWAKVQGASPAWHKVDTTSLVVQVTAPPPPAWVPATPGKLKVGDQVKTTQGNATITGFQGKAWVSVEANVLGGAPIKKWHPVKELQVPGPGQGGAPAPPPPATTPKAPPPAPTPPSVGPAGHGLQAGVTKIHSTITGKTGTVGFISASGFMINFDDGTVGTGTWPQLGSGHVSVVTGKTPIAHPAPPPAPKPVGLDQHGNPLMLGDSASYTGTLKHEPVHVVGVMPNGSVEVKFSDGSTTYVSTSKLIKQTGATPGVVATNSKGEPLHAGDTVTSSKTGKTYQLEGPSGSHGLVLVKEVATGHVSSIMSDNLVKSSGAPTAPPGIHPPGTVVEYTDLTGTHTGTVFEYSPGSKMYGVEANGIKFGLHESSLKVAGQAQPPATPPAPPAPAWVPAVPGKVGVGTKVLTPNGPGVVVEMQGKAWAAIDGAKPKWQKVTTLQVEGIAGPGASPVPKIGGTAPVTSHPVPVVGQKVYDPDLGQAAEVVSVDLVKGTVKLESYGTEYTKKINEITIPSGSFYAPPAIFTDKLGQKYAVGATVVAPNGMVGEVIGPGSKPGTVVVEDSGLKVEFDITKTLLVKSTAPTINAGTVSGGPKNYQGVENDTHWANQWSTKMAGLTASEKAALQAYTGSAYSSWNRQLRTSNGNPGSYASKIKAVDQAMWKLGADRDIIVYRGASNTGISDWTSMIGGYYTDHAYQSTSVRASSTFSGEVKFTFKVPQGTPGIYLSSISQFASEREFLLARGTRVHITHAKKVGSQWHVVAEVDPDPNQPRP